MTVGPKLTIKGKIEPGTDEKGKTSMPSTIDVTQFVPINLEHERLSPVTRRISVDGQGHFTATDLLACETQVEAGGQTFKVNLDRPETSVTIDLTQGESRPQTLTRRVVLRVTTPDGAIAPSGSIYVYAGGSAGGQPLFNQEMSLQGGQAAIDAPVPGRVSYQSRSMVGYWFKDGDVEVEPGEGETVVDIPAVPAGAIAGQVLDHNGSPVASGVDISCRTVESAPGLQREVFIRDNIRVDASGRFFVSPLPLGGSYAVIASRGHNRQVSPTVRLDESKVTERVTLKFGRNAVAEVRVVGPDGRPLAGMPVGLELVHPTAGGGWAPPSPTDRDGRFRFDDLSPDLDGYRAIVEAAKNYQPAQADLRPDGPPIQIRLERGHVITGRVLDAKTGWPIPGLTIYAYRPVVIAGTRNAFEAEAKTDEQGRFRFSNLPKGSWQLNDRDGLEWASPNKSRAFGVDGPEPIEIQASLPSWSRLKPMVKGSR